MQEYIQITDDFSRRFSFSDMIQHKDDQDSLVQLKTSSFQRAIQMNNDRDTNKSIKGYLFREDLEQDDQTQPFQNNENSNDYYMRLRQSSNKQLDQKMDRVASCKDLQMQSQLKHINKLDQCLKFQQEQIKYLVEQLSMTDDVHQQQYQTNGESKIQNIKTNNMNQNQSMESNLEQQQYYERENKLMQLKIKNIYFDSQLLINNLQEELNQMNEHLQKIDVNQKFKLITEQTKQIYRKNVEIKQQNQKLEQIIHQNYQMFKNDSQEYQRIIEKLNLKINRIQEQKSHKHKHKHNHNHKNPFENNLNNRNSFKTVENEASQESILILKSNINQQKIDKIRKSNSSIQDEIKNLKDYLGQIVKLNKLRDNK